MWYNPSAMKIFHNERRNKGGFTLIEMTIVLFIILAFMAMSVPFFANFSSSTGLKTAEREVCTILRTTRSYAISQNSNFNVVFDTGVTPNTYRITNSSGTTLDKTYQLSSGVAFTATAPITFTSNGGLASGSATGITINSIKGGSKQITVEAATGAVTMQ